MAPTIFLRLRQYVHHMYLGGHTKAQGRQMFGCRIVAAELPKILLEQGANRGPIGEDVSIWSVVFVYMRKPYGHQIARGGC